MNKTFSVTVDFDQLVEDHDRNGNIGYLYLRECYKRLEVTAFLKKYQLNAELFAFFVYTDVIDDLQNLQEIYDYRRHYLHGPQYLKNIVVPRIYYPYWKLRNAVSSQSYTKI